MNSTAGDRAGGVGEWHRCYELTDSVSKQAKNKLCGGVRLYPYVNSCRHRVVNVDLAQFVGSSLRFVQSAPPRQTSTTVRAPERLVLNAWRLVSATGAVRMCTPSKRMKDDKEGSCVYHLAIHSTINLQ